MKRQIIRIDEEKCNGCGQCVNACAEGALKIIDGKARLVSEVYCDGLGACIGECPQGALTIETRDAAGFDEKAVAQHAAPPKPAAAAGAGHHHHGCPGSMVMSLRTPGGTGSTAPLRCADHGQDAHATAEDHGQDAHATAEDLGQDAHATNARPSQLGNWPVQLMLAPVEAPFFDGADLLISADCVPYALASFHETLLPDKVVLVGCPKLDDAAFYAEKLTAILQSNNIRSVTVAHMEVPCCNGIVLAARRAMEASDKNDITFRDVKVGIRGEILSDHQSAPVGEGANE